MSSASAGTAAADRASLRPLLMLAGTLLALLPLAPATFAIVVVYMLPTWLTALTRPLAVPGALATMAGLNLAGLMPAVNELWQADGGFDEAFLIMIDVDLLAIDLAACGIAMAILVTAPFLARAWAEAMINRTHSSAEAAKRRLLDEWGAGLEEDARPKSLVRTQD